MVRPKSSAREPGVPPVCTVLHKGQGVTLQIHDGGDVLVDAKVQPNTIEIPRQPTSSADRAAFEKVWLIREGDVCGVGVTG